ncbi:MAG: virulence protein [Lachnospiraceae bacterium]|nr:virulence protein [Lachnospiraceae bacterium]MBP3902185.1 virulence protein [Blautia sp.]
MKANYNVTGEDRKQLVAIISREAGIQPVYTRMPECAFVIGNMKVTKTGELLWDERTDAALIDRIIAALATAGFTAEEEDTEAAEDAPEEVTEDTETEEAETEEETDEDASDEGGLTVTMPRDFFTDDALENLKKIVASKRTLLMKALGADDLPILISDETVSFPWFPEPSPAEAQTFTNLITAICRMAKEAKRVTAKEKETESEKYTFRCWLLRLGFVGAEHKHDRAILLQNLSGHAAFKNQADADAFYQRLKEKKAAQKAAAQEAEDGEEATDDAVSE